MLLSSSCWILGNTFLESVTFNRILSKRRMAKGHSWVGWLYYVYRYKGVVWQQNLSQQASQHCFGTAFRFEPLLFYCLEWLVIQSSSFKKFPLPNILLFHHLRWMVSCCWSLKYKYPSQLSWQVQEKCTKQSTCTLVSHTKIEPWNSGQCC